MIRLQRLFTTICLAAILAAFALPSTMEAGTNPLPNTGFPHGTGFTHAQYPAGFFYDFGSGPQPTVSFDNYTDLSTGVPSDERKFMGIKNETKNDPPSGINNTSYVYVDNNDEILVSTYIHNNAPSAWNQYGYSVAANTRVYNYFDFNKVATSHSISSYIYANNAVVDTNNLSIKTISDNTGVVSRNGKPIKLQFIADSAKFYQSAKAFGENGFYYYTFTPAQANALFTGSYSSQSMNITPTSGQSIGNRGTKNRDDIFGGSYYGCNEYLGYIVYKMRAVSSYGTVRVSSNLPNALFTVTNGNDTYTQATRQPVQQDSSYVWTFSDVPTGNYQITWGAVAGYTTPAPASGVLNNGETLIFNGAYGQYDLSASISVDDASVAPNILNNPSNPLKTKLTYLVSYKNVGNSPLTGVNITVNYDQSKERVLTAASGVNNGDTIVWQVGNLNAGNEGTFTLETELIDGVGIPPTTYITSVAGRMTEYAQDRNPANNDGQVTITVNEANRSSQRKRVTNLRTGITSTALTAFEGDELEYVLSFTAGDTAVTNHVFTDNISDVLQYSTLTDNGSGTVSNGVITFPAVPNIPAYQTAQVRFVVTILTDITAVVGGDYRLTNTYGNDVTVVALPDLQRQKEVRVGGDDWTTTDVAMPGQILTYRLTVSNVGAGDRQGFVFEDNITDILEYSTIQDLDADAKIEENANEQMIISWQPVVIPAGGSVSKEFQVQINNPLIAGGDYTLRNVFGDAVAVVTIPDVIASKSVASAATGQSGKNISACTGDGPTCDGVVLTYTLTATERGGAAAYPSFTFQDDVTDILEYTAIGNISDGGARSGGLITWPAVSIPAGQTLTRTFTATIIPFATWPQGYGYDRTLANEFHGDVVQAALPGTMPEVDNYVQKSVSSTAAQRSDLLTYTINYGNSGNIPATNTRISDNYNETLITIENPGGGTDDGNILTWNLGTLAVGATGTITYTARVHNDAPENIDLVNTANIAANEVDGDYSDNSSSTYVAIESADVQIWKAVAPEIIENGEVTYTINIENRSDQPASTVITDTLGSGALNGSAGGSVTCIAGSQSIQSQADPQGNQASFTGDICTPAGLSLTNIPVNRDVAITYRANVSNAGVAPEGISYATNTARSSFQVQDNGATLTIQGPSNTGRVVVLTNIAAPVSIINTSGVPAPYNSVTADTGQGNFQSSAENAPVGDYRVEYGAVPCYTTPAAQGPLPLSIGQTLTFPLAIYLDDGTCHIPTIGTLTVRTVNTSNQLVNASFTTTFPAGSVPTTINGQQEYINNAAPLGVYTVNFGALNGYTYLPASSMASGTLTAASPLILTGVYQQNEGPGPGPGPIVVGGGGGSPGISLPPNFYNYPDIKIKHQVGGTIMTYREADGESTAYYLGNSLKEKEVFFRVSLTNPTDIFVSNVKLRPRFIRGENQLELLKIKAVEGAEYDPIGNVFTVKSKIPINSEKERVFTYKAIVRNNGALTAQNVASSMMEVTDYKADAQSDHKRGVGVRDSAFVASGMVSYSPQQASSIEKQIEKGSPVAQKPELVEKALPKTGIEIIFIALLAMAGASFYVYRRHQQ